jgi:hypothetical protein
MFWEISTLKVTLFRFKVRFCLDDLSLYDFYLLASNHFYKFPSTSQSIAQIPGSFHFQ